MTPLVARAAATYDRLERVWVGPRTHRRVATVIAASFLAGIVAAEMNRRGLIAPAVGHYVPTSHFFSVRVAFDLVLLTEIIGLVFSLGRSVANSLGKQMEVFALILLRKSFEELTYFQEPVVWSQVGPVIGAMVADAVGALLMVMGLVVYYRLQQHHPITADPTNRESFVALKKLTGLVLLAALVVLGVQAVRAWSGDHHLRFFEDVFTVLIFSDIWIVLLSLRTTARFEIVFRNSAFAAATLFMRLSLTAPAYINAALGLLAVCFGCGVTYAYNRWTSDDAFRFAGSRDAVPDDTHP